MSETEVQPEARRRDGLSRRQRQRAVRGGQYAVFVLLVLLLVILADWEQMKTQFANGDLAREMFPEVVTVAMRNTVIYTVTGYALGFALGLVIALMRLSTVGPYRWFATTYIEIFRGLPALLVFIFVTNGIPFAFPGFEMPFGTYGEAMLALGLVSSAYLAETFRAGIQAVPRGQMEAARSLGMSYGWAMFTIVMPQAIRIMIPPLTNQLVLLFKDSSLVLFLGVFLHERELAKFARDHATEHANSTPIIVAGVCYLAITVPLGYLARRLEARQARGR